MSDGLNLVLLAVAVAGLLAALLLWWRGRRREAVLRAANSAQAAELTRLTERMQRGLDGMGAALWEWNVVKDTIYLSDHFLRLTGYEREEFGTEAARFFACLHEDDRALTKHALEDYLALETGNMCAIDLRFACQSGDFLWMHLQAVGTWDREGHPLKLSGSLSDITSKVEAEQERDRLFNLSTDMLSVAGFDQYQQQLNPAWVRVLGWSRDELMGHTISHFIQPADRAVFDRAWELLRQGTPSEGLEIRFRCRDGSYRWLSWGSFPYADRQVVFSVVRDISNQKQAEQQLIEYQDRLRSLNSQLALVEERQRRELAVAIHDGLAQQLFGIRAQMVLLKYPDKVPDLAGIVAQIIAILDETMSDARSLSFELFPPVLYEVGLEAALTWLAHKFSETNEVLCCVEVEGEGDELPEEQRSMAYQCVRELLANVRKYAEAGNVGITLSHVDRFLTIVVEDDGAGFDVHKLERPQSSTATSGFGLFSIRERLRSLDGRMLVDSRPGQGTRVFLSFPRDGAARFGTGPVSDG